MTRYHPEGSPPFGYVVETRECQFCRHSKRLWDGWICSKHLMAITADMRVTYLAKEGTCWKARRKGGAK